MQVAVSGRVARVTVEEWFRNTGPIMGEGSYVYPLPGEAVFSEYSLWQGDQELKGEMMDATQARSIYEAIVRQKRDPALIELAGHGMIRARVFPIGPGETRKITLRYIQVLDRLGDAWRLRYASGADATPRSFHMQIDSASRIGEPYSPTHRVTAVRRGDQMEVTLADATWSGDLEVLLPLTRGLVGMSLITHRPGSERDGFFMVLVAPGQVTERTLRRDLVAVLDVSGSMSGEKLNQAKAALVQLVGALRSGDRFRLIAFSSTVRTPFLRLAGGDSRQRARCAGLGPLAHGGRRYQHRGRPDRGVRRRPGRGIARRRGLPHRRPPHRQRDESRTDRRCGRPESRTVPRLFLRHRV